MDLKKLQRRIREIASRNINNDVQKIIGQATLFNGQDYSAVTLAELFKDGIDGHLTIYDVLEQYQDFLIATNIGHYEQEAIDALVGKEPQYAGLGFWQISFINMDPERGLDNSATKETVDIVYDDYQKVRDQLRYHDGEWEIEPVSRQVYQSWIEDTNDDPDFQPFFKPF